MAVDFANLAYGVQLKIDEEGNRRWTNFRGQLHREDGPAIIYADGVAFWYRNGELDTSIRD